MKIRTRPKSWRFVLLEFFVSPDSTYLPANAKPSTRRVRNSFIEDAHRNGAFYLMLLPAVIAVILFSYLPLRGIVIAFLDYSPIRGYAGSPWVGLENFQAMFQSPFFGTALRNTITINVMKLLIGFPSAIILALLLNEVRLGWFKRAVQTATILPYFISWVVAATMFRSIFAPEGVLNEVIQHVFGGQAVIFLSDPAKFPLLIVIQDTWKFCGFFAVLYLAAMAAIDPALYDAAMVDGAGRWEKMRHVTLPGIRPTMVTLFILLTGWIIQGGFEQIIVMYNTSVYSTGDVLETLTYRLAISQGKYGVATAVGLFQSVLSILLVLTVNTTVRRFNKQGLVG
jgi:ABC-type polysaccharide transport system permease subunit